MKIALIGYGAMGKLIKTLAENKNHEITIIIDESDANLSAEELSEKLKGVDTAIDFSSAEAVKRNVEACLLANLPLVEGTTGWNDEKESGTPAFWRMPSGPGVQPASESNDLARSGSKL